MQLHWADHAVIASYLAVMMLLGWKLAKRQHSDEEYFLGSRKLPWFAVGVSVIASLLSSITYLSEPGNVWRYGFANIVGKLVAVPIEMLLVFSLCIPFFMRFRFTSAYEYLEHRFNLSVRLAGAALFCVMMIAWMGVIVLVSSRALAAASGVDLNVVIITIGVVATGYTLLGGIRAVVWTDVVQVALLVGGGLFILGYVAVVTQSTPLEWIRTVQARSTSVEMRTFSLNPTIPATTATLMLQMLVWHVCTHCANQMTMQRYFSTSDLSAARRSFLTGSLLGIFLNLMLAGVGAALVYYYTHGPETLPSSIDLVKGVDRDSIFPRFVTMRIPPGFAGAIFAALLAAAMSTIDSGVNSFATVVTVDFGRLRNGNGRPDHVRSARVTTLLVGTLVTVAAIVLDTVTHSSDILSMMPKSFNCFLGALGGVFLVGMFVPRAGNTAAWASMIVGLVSALAIAYSKELLTWLKPNWYSQSVDLLGEEFASRLFANGLGFTWVLPVSCLLAIVTAVAVSAVAPDRSSRPGLTWWTRRQTFDPPE